MEGEECQGPECVVVYESPVFFENLLGEQGKMADGFLVIKEHSAAGSRSARTYRDIMPPNRFVSVYRLEDGKAEALEFYQEIKTKYPQSVEGYDIDKYISRIQNK